MEGPAPGRRGRRSSSRSPSLTRRPSLREKGGASGITKPKKKTTSGKKERWLLTRKTWRYMTDAVGNLMPEHHRTTTTGPSTTSSPEPIPGPAAMGVVPCGHGTGAILAGAGAAYEGRKRQSIARASICSGSGTGYAAAPLDDIPSLETEFGTVCTKERKFLLWTRTRAKGLSGPALRELKEKQKKGLDEFGPDLDDDYDEYEEEPEEQVTVRERRRKSSAASSIVSMVSGGLAFFRPITPTAHTVSGSGDTFRMVTVDGVTRHYRSTGIQTDPFSEELLIRLRLKSVQEEKLLLRKEAELRRAELDEAQNQALQAEAPPAEAEACQTDQPLPAEENVSPPPGEVAGQAEPDKKSEESGYSSSISDTVMRYLRMARKNSKADTKEAIDKFKTVNYDRSLRYIKSKNVTVEEALEHEKNKALQAQQKLEAAEQAASAPPPSTLSKSPPPSPQPSPSAPSTSAPAPESKPTPPAPLAKTPKAKKSSGLKLKTTGRKVKATTTTPAVSEPVSIPGSAERPDQDLASVEPMRSPGSPSGEPSTTPQVQVLSSSVTSTTSGAVLVGSEEADKSRQVVLDEAEKPKKPSAKEADKSRLAPPPSAQPASIGVQAGESLIRFLRYTFNPRRKLSDFSSASESPAELTSPRYSIGTGSDTSDLYVLMQLQHEREVYGGGSTAPQSSSTGRSSLVELYSGEYDDVFQGGERDSARSSMSMSVSMSGSQGGTGPVLSKSTSAQLIRTCGSATSVAGTSTYGQTTHHHSHLGLGFSTSAPRASVSTPTTPTASPGYSTKGGVLKSSTSTASFTSTLLSHLKPGSKSGSSGGSGAYPATTFADSFTSLISKRGGSGWSRKGQGGPSVSFQGSLVAHKGGLSLGLKEGPSAYTNPSSSACLVMQKSKSSSSVVQTHGGGEKRGSTSSTSGGLGMGGSSGGAGSRLMSKTRIFKSRSKSQTRLGGGTTCTWTPQGKCKWTSVTGQQVTLDLTSALTLSEVERMTLQKVALAKLQALNLGVEVKIPREKPASSQKPKRRPYLLKKKALSTGFFDSGTKRDDGKDLGGSSGLVFGIPLSQCVMNDRQKRGLGPNYLTLADWEQGSLAGGYTASRNGSRNSVSSVFDGGREDKSGSSESLFWGKRGSNAALDNISCSSADLLGDNIPTELAQASSAVPTIVTSCIRHLETFGLRTTGIFRVSTSLKRIRQLREEIDGGKEVEFTEEHSPHDVAALLKEFIRDLPEPLLCRDLQHAFLLTQKIRNRRLQLEAVQHLIQLLPVPNRDTLAAILQFFAKVVENASDTRSKTGEVIYGNKMEGYSLATLIAPNLLPCMLPDGTALTMEQNAVQTRERRESIDVVNYMISSYKELFLVTPELLDEVYVHMMDTHPDAVETILKFKATQQQSEDPGLEELETTSSVFEGSECGELGEGDDPMSLRKFQKREDILHKDGGKGGQLETRGRGKREGSREREAEKQQSGGESDSSSTSVTKSANKSWFRRGRTDHKTRTSSDSGSEKAKGQKRESSLHEAKRASSLDSVSLKGAALPTVVQVTEHVGDRQRSCSDQSLKVPESLSRRQSSPVLESVGVITASLKIPVPLNIDDTDIPFIEEESAQEALTHHLFAHLDDTDTDGGPRNTPSSSHTTTPLSSPLRQTSSEVSSPMTFSPPSSPPYDPATFPYEEMTARFCLGTTPMPSHPQLSSPALAQATSRTLAPTQDKPASPTPTAYQPTPSDLRLGKETKGASIAGLIKSKTADFEKFAQDQQHGSIAPNMRLRSQGNIALKQQFLLRQHEKHQVPPTRTGSGTLGEAEGHALPSSRSLSRKKPLAASSSAILGKAEPSSQKVSSASGASKTGATTSSGGGSSSRWKRSEIISSPSRHPGPPTGDPETFV